MLLRYHKGSYVTVFGSVCTFFPHEGLQVLCVFKQAPKDKRLEGLFCVMNLLGDHGFPSRRSKVNTPPAADSPGFPMVTQWSLHSPEVGGQTAATSLRALWEGDAMANILPCRSTVRYISQSYLYPKVIIAYFDKIDKITVFKWCPNHSLF